MDKRFLFSFLGAFMVMYVLAFFFHVIIADGYIHTVFENVVKPGAHHEELWGILVNYLIVALAMAWIYPRGYDGGSPVTEGFRFGLAIGILVHISAAFALSATMDISLSGILGDKLWHVVETICGGITIGLIRGKMN